MAAGSGKAGSSTAGHRQLFAPGADAVFRFYIAVACVLLVGGLVVAQAVSRSSWATGVGEAPGQPVPFSHKHHAGQLGIDCRYCHQQVEYAASAGIPPTHTCMTCHSQIWTGAPMLAPVRDSLAQNHPLAWVRVNRLPDYVYFNHAIHVAKGIGCSSCHGPVARMQLMYRAQAFTMQFCIDCHRNPVPRLRPAAEIWNTEWQAPADQARIGRALLLQYHIAGPARLTDCSICHR